jgi:methylmalonyl-CoA mutase N-terminal domain/subunit
VQALSVDPALEADQRSRVRAWRAGRDQQAVDGSLERLVETARGTGNIMYPMKDALAGGATLGEVSEALRQVFGVHRAR